MEQGCHTGYPDSYKYCPRFDLVIGQFRLASNGASNGGGGGADGRVAVLIVNQDDRHRVQPGLFAYGDNSTCRNGGCMKVWLCLFLARPCS